MTAAQEGGRLWTRDIGLVAGVLLVAAGGAYVLVHAFAGDRYGPEGWPQHLALGLPLMASGLIAVLGSVTKRPVLVVAGGVAAIPMCIVSFLGIPALLPAGAAIAAGAASNLRSTSARDWVNGAAIVAALVGAFGYEVLHQDPAEWTTPSGSAGSSNVITPTESIVVYVAAGLALVLALSCLRANQPSRRSSATS